MKKIIAVLLTVLLGVGALSGCMTGGLADITLKSGITLTAEEFIENSHYTHPNAKMNADYTAITLEKSVGSNFGYLVKTIKYRVAKGSYRFSAKVKVSIGNDSDPVVQLHGLDSKDKVIVSLNIMGPSKSAVFHDYAIDFRVEEDTFMSFGVYSNGRNSVQMEKLSIVKTDMTVSQTRIADWVNESEQDKAIKYEDGKLYYYDILSKVTEVEDYALQEQLMTAVSVLQGLVNRDKPRLYVRFLDDNGHNASLGNQDDFWLDYLSEEKNWLPKGDDIIKVDSAGTLFRIFSGYYSGLTVWDHLAPATYNAGLTDCGVNGRLLVKYSDDTNSMYRYMTEVLNIPVKLDLHNKFDGNKRSKIWDTNTQSTGSKKNDVYIWAIEKYLSTNKTNPNTLCSYLDGWVGDNGVTQKVYYDESGALYYGTGGIPVWTNRYTQTDIMNRDYFISKKAFFFDLNPVAGDTPIDDLNQEEGLDASTLETILKINNLHAGNNIVEVGGFTNWQLKYSDASNESAIDGGALEPSMVRLLTKYNCTMQADASSISAMANASVYTHYPALTQYNQDDAQTRMKGESEAATLQNKNYVLIYMGDYDGSAWCNRTLASMFNDPNLGKVPLMWPVCAVNETRVKHVYDYIYEKATTNDIFVGGNNGYGYNYLDYFIKGDRTGINGDIVNYFDKTLAAYNKYDLDIMGMYFGGWDASTAKKEERDTIYGQLARLSPYGVVTSRGMQVDVGGEESDYYNADTGTVYMCKDPFQPGRDSTVQCGNQNFVIEGNQQHQLSVMSQSINVTELNRPHFNVLRPVLATPTQIYEGINTLNRKYPDYKFEAVNPYTFFKLYKQYMDNVVAGNYV